MTTCTPPPSNIHIPTMTQSVAICIITFNRPEGLRKALESLARLQFPSAPPSITAVVIDNDPNGSARPICDDVRQKTNLNIVFEVEPKRGIPFVRNHAVKTALTLAEYICFIDDDEWVEPNWLAELLAAKQRYLADVVTGPVHPVAQQPNPNWKHVQPFFDPPQHQTGAVVQTAYTNNVLVDANVYRSMTNWFDERLALTGGSDGLFFTKVAAGGHKIVWTNDARVHELIPPSRANPRWVYRRAYRFGLMSSFMAYDLRPSLVTRIRSLFTALVRLAKGCVFLPLTLPLGRQYQITYIRHMYYGAGIIAGVTGRRFDEYKETHGT
jgi:glycosyltransferase involved in cell wall biosynthesis